MKQTRPKPTPLAAALLAALLLLGSCSTTYRYRTHRHDPPGRVIVTAPGKRIIIEKNSHDKCSKRKYKEYKKRRKEYEKQRKEYEKRRREYEKRRRD